MKKFQYKLDPLLKYRENRRDLCRQVLAQVLASDQQLINQKQSYQAEYQNVEQELKKMGQSGTLDIDKSSARRFHLGQLKIQILTVDENRRQLKEQLDLCRKALVQADQDVKVLEKLKTKKQTEYQHEQIRHENIELEETWRATQPSHKII